MKKLLFCRITTLLVMSIFLFSCSTNEGEKGNDGSKNTTDVSVTGNVLEVGVTYAQIEGYVNLNQVTSSYTNQQIGVELSLTENFTNTIKFTTKELEGNKLTILAKELDVLTKYYYRTFVYINNLYYYGEKRSFTTKDFSNITSTGDAYDLTLTSAKINCKIDVNSLNTLNSYIIGVYYSTIKDKLHPDSLKNSNLPNVSTKLNYIQDDSYTFNISKLKSGTTYYYCSYTKAGSMYKMGETKSFSTYASTSSNISTGDATNITLTTATIQNYSTIASLYPNQKISYGVSYSTSKESLKNQNNNCYSVNASFMNNYFTAELKDLKPNTTYYYHAFVNVPDASITGEIKSFTTKQGTDYLITGEASDITNNSATLRGTSTLSTDYPYNSIKYDIRYALSSSDLSSSSTSYSSSISVNGNDIVGLASNLKANTKYHYCLTAYLNNMYVYGDIKTFTTKSWNYIGKGTKESPFTIADAIHKCQEIGETSSSEKYYVKGIVVTGGKASGGYGNITFTMGDTKDASEVLKAYQVAGSDGDKLANGFEVNAGEEVIVYGSIYNYQGKTPQTTGNGTAQIVTINGKKTNEGGATGGDGSANNPFNIAAAIAKCQQIGETASTEKYYVKGIVVVGGKASGGYGNITFKMGDTRNSTNLFTAYQVAGSDGEKLEDGFEVKTGSEVIIYGPLVNYKGNTPETPGKSAAQIVTIDGKKTNKGADGSTIISVASFNAAAESTDVWYQLTGKVKNLKDGDQCGNFDLEDSTGSVYVYGLLSEKGGAKKKFQELVTTKGIANDKTITIVGNRGSYYGKIEVTNAYFISIK